MSGRFVAVFRASLLIERKRVAPYAVGALFAGNALLWWYKGPAQARGVAPNDESMIAGMCTVFTFMTLPLFTAVLMSSSLLRDFEDSVDSLVFSSPVKDAEYVAGKFLSSFAVLVACEAAFVLTLCLLQWAPGDVGALPPRVLPFVRQFVGIIVISSAPLAALCFGVAAFSRNGKAAYAVVLAVYAVYAIWQVQVLRALPAWTQVLLDPLLMAWSNRTHRDFDYSTAALVNRGAMITVTVALIAIVCARFTTLVRAAEPRLARTGLSLGLGTRRARRATGVERARGATARTSDRHAATSPVVRITPSVLRHSLAAFFTSTRLELRLLWAEKSIAVAVPLTILLCIVQLSGIRADVNGAGVYAAGLQGPMMLVLFAVAVFYTGEAMHRDRLVRVEPLIWSTSTGDTPMLLAKLMAPLILAALLILTGTLCAVSLEISRTGAVPRFGPYAAVAVLILLPTAAFMISVTAAVHALVRERYLGHVVLLGIGGALYSLYALGYTHPLYNFPLLDRWDYADLGREGPTPTPLVLQRAYVLTLSVVAVAVSQLRFARPPGAASITSRWPVRRRASLATLLVASLCCAAIAVMLLGT